MIDSRECACPELELDLAAHNIHYHVDGERVDPTKVTTIKRKPAINIITHPSIPENEARVIPVPVEGPIGIRW